MLIIHGDNQPASREQLLVLKSNETAGGKYIVELEASSLNLNSLISALNSSSLLGNTASVFIQNLFTGRPGKNKKEIVEYLQKNPKSDIFIWEGRDITRQLKDFPQSVIRKYSLGSDLFRFLDNLNVNSLQAALSNTPAEQIFILLADRIRKLIIIKEEALNKSLAMNLPAWQIKKLSRQATGYTIKQLAGGLDQLTQIDFLNKTSRLPYDLGVSLELWVLRL
jgi:hypothetical protein